MKENVLSGRQLICLTWLFLLGSAAVSGGGGPAGRDTWGALVLAAVAAIPLVLIYARVSTLFEERNLFDMLLRVFGKWFGRLISLCVILYCFMLGTLTLREFPVFVQTASLPKTPKIIFAAILGLICAYLAALGVRSFGKAGILFSAAAGCVIILTFLLLLPNMEFGNIRPVLGARWEDIGKNAAMFFGAPFGESVLLLCLFCDMKPGHSKYKAYFWGLMLGGAFLTAIILGNILSLGTGNFMSLSFPSYSAVSTINIGDYFQRAEVMAVSCMLLCDIIKIAVALYAACLGVASIFNITDYRKAVPVLALAMIPLSVFVSRDTVEIFRRFPGSLAYLIPIQVVIPLILWIWGESRIARKPALMP